MKVSVVIPVKADPDGLQRTLASLPLGQKIETLVIDAGDCPATLALIDERGADVNYYESGLDSGIADAMNRGIERSTGTHVTILNAGDEWFSNTLRHFEDTLEANPDAEVYHGTVEYVTPLGHSYCVVPDPTKLHKRMWIFHPTMFVRREFYRKNGVYRKDFALAMDSEWVHRAIVAQARFVDTGHAMARMHLGGRSDTGYKAALIEFRKSVILHGLASRMAAYYNYYSVLNGKRIARLLRAERWQSSQLTRQLRRTSRL